MTSVPVVWSQTSCMMFWKELWCVRPSSSRSIVSPRAPSPCYPVTNPWVDGVWVHGSGKSSFSLHKWCSMVNNQDSKMVSSETLFSHKEIICTFNFVQPWYIKNMGMPSITSILKTYWFHLCSFFIYVYDIQNLILLLTLASQMWLLGRVLPYTKNTR